MIYLSEEILDKMIKKRKKYIVISAIVLALCIILCTIFSILATYQSHLWAIIANTIITSFALGFVFFSISALLFPISNKIAFVRKTLSYPQEKIEGEITEIKENFTRLKNIMTRGIKLEGRDRWLLCYDNGDVIFPKLNQNVILTLADGYVIVCEVKDEEKDKRQNEVEND